MPFAIPSLRDLVERARLAFRANLPGTDAWLWPNNIGPSAKVMGGLTSEVFGYADYIARQKFARTADRDGLIEHGAEYGLAPRPASPAGGPVVFTASTALTVLDGAILSRADGVTYRVVTGGVLLAAGSLTLNVVSEAYAKTAISIAGTALTPISGVTGTAAVVVGTGGIVGGTDLEDTESFRDRVLFRKRNVPQGGSAADYVIWGREVAGVTRVYVERLFAGPGTVRVFPIFDDEFPGGVAPAGRIDIVAAYIAALAPASAQVQVSAPNPATIDITISGLTPDTPAVREAVLAELRSAFRRLGRVAGSNTFVPGMPYLATPLSFSRSWIWQAVANAAGEQAHVVAAPSSDVSVPVGSIPVLGTVTFAP